MVALCITGAESGRPAVAEVAVTACAALTIACTHHRTEPYRPGDAKESGASLVSRAYDAVWPQLIAPITHPNTTRVLLIRMEA